MNKNQDGSAQYATNSVLINKINTNSTVFQRQSWIDRKESIYRSFSCVKNPNRYQDFRFLVLILAIVPCFSYYFCYDLPNSLSNLIVDKLTHETSERIMYNQLYTVISLPNIFIPIFGGLIVTKFGVDICIISLIVIFSVGQIIFTIAGFIANDNTNDITPFMLALFGRFIFGLGGETLNVCQIVIISKYFKNKELSFAIGAFYSLTWLGAPMCNYIIPSISSMTSLGTAIAVADILCVISLLSAIIFIYIDMYTQESRSSETNYLNSDDDFKCEDVKDLPYPFWLLMINLVFIFIGCLYDSISNDYFSARYGFDQTEAAQFGANSNMLFIIMTPILGLVVDKYGQRATGIIISACTLIISQVLFILIPPSTQYHRSYLGYFPIMILMLGQAVYISCLFSSAELLVKPSLQGTAYGFTLSAINVGMFIGSCAVGALIFEDMNEQAYFWVNVTLLISGCLALLTGIKLFIIDKYVLSSRLQRVYNENEQEDEQLLSQSMQFPPNYSTNYSTNNLT